MNRITKASKQTRTRSVRVPPPAAAVDHNQEMARFCTWVEFFMVCSKPPCRRHRACRGDATACFRRHWATLPDAFKTRLELVLDFLRNGMSSRRPGATEAEFARRAAAAAQAGPETLSATHPQARARARSVGPAGPLA